MKESFNGLVRRSGPVVIATIPSFLIKDGRLIVGRHYRFVVEEVESDAEQ